MIPRATNRSPALCPLSPPKTLCFCAAPATQTRTTSWDPRHQWTARIGSDGRDTESTPRPGTAGRRATTALPDLPSVRQMSLSVILGALLSPISHCGLLARPAVGSRGEHRGTSATATSSRFTQESWPPSSLYETAVGQALVELANSTPPAPPAAPDSMPLNRNPDMWALWGGRSSL